MGRELVSERMTPRKRLLIAAADLSVDEAWELLWEWRLEKLPLVDGQGCLVGWITAKDAFCFDCFLTDGKSA